MVVSSQHAFSGRHRNFHLLCHDDGIASFGHHCHDVCDARTRAHNIGARPIRKRAIHHRLALANLHLHRLTFLYRSDLRHWGVCLCFDLYDLRFWRTVFQHYGSVSGSSRKCNRRRSLDRHDLGWLWRRIDDDLPRHQDLDSTRTQRLALSNISSKNIVRDVATSVH